MAVLPDAEDHQTGLEAPRRIPGEHLGEFRLVCRGRRLGIRNPADLVEGGGNPGEQCPASHSGVAVRVIPGHVPLIGHPGVDAFPRNRLEAQQLVGEPGGGPSGEADGGPAAVLANPLGHLVGSGFGECPGSREDADRHGPTDGRSGGRSPFG